MRAIIVGAALVASLLAADSAMAQGRCKVTDPTGTPLNVRSAPQGAVIGQIGNGRTVQIIDRATDAAGKPWVYIVAPNGRPIGWVFREFISCF